MKHSVRAARDVYGALASAGVTGLVFAVGPLCAMLWFVQGGDVVELIAPMVDDSPAVMLDWSAYEALDDPDGEGDGGTHEGEVAAGPDPTIGSDGNGASDAIADSSGDEGQDEVTARAVPGVPRKSARHGTVARTARGARGDAFDGYPDPASKLRAERAKRSSQRSRCPSSHPDVRRLESGRWTVNRSLVEYYTRSIKRFNSLGWSGPYENERYKGWKIGGFGCKSPLYHAGLRRGDIVLTVNDKPTRTWLQVFGAYTKLKRKDQFEVVVVRRGKRKVLHYTLVQGGPPTTS